MRKRLGSVLGMTVVAIVLGMIVFGQPTIDTGESPNSAVTSSVWAESVNNMSYMAERADIIFRGSVTQVGSAEWATSTGQKPRTVEREDIRDIHRHVTFDIEEVLKGPRKDTIKLRVGGGEVGRYSVEVIDAPEFSEGEQVLVFVQKWEGDYRPLWKKYGTFNADKDVIRRPNVPIKYQQRINVSDLLDSLRERY